MLIKFVPYHDALLTWYLRLIVALDIFVVLMFWNGIKTPGVQPNALGAFREIVFATAFVLLSIVILSALSVATTSTVSNAAFWLLVASVAFTTAVSTSTGNNLFTKLKQLVLQFRQGGQLGKWSSNFTSTINRRIFHNLAEGSFSFSRKFDAVFKLKLHSTSGIHPIWRLATVIILFFTWGIAAFPGEWVYQHGPLPLTHLIFESTMSPLSNRLQLANEVLVDFDRVEKQQVSLMLSHRDLRSAVLDGADLRKANLSSADLTEASLKGAKLSDAELSYARLERAVLAGAQLDGAHLNNVKLVGANIEGASLLGAQVTNADLTAASLRAANLQGADLQMSNLTGSSLSGADAQGAIFVAVSFEGASLRDIRLQWADIKGARFWQALLDGVSVSLSSLSAVERRVHPVNLEGAWVDRIVYDQDAEKLRAGVMKALSRNRRPSERQIARHELLANSAQKVQNEEGGKEEVLDEQWWTRVKSQSTAKWNSELRFLKCFAESQINLACCGYIEGCSVSDFAPSPFIADGIVEHDFLGSSRLQTYTLAALQRLHEGGGSCPGGSTLSRRAAEKLAKQVKLEEANHSRRGRQGALLAERNSVSSSVTRHSEPSCSRPQ
jgi:uncharacterized protein YjbI with pentapeptide repeats